MSWPTDAHVIQAGKTDIADAVFSYSLPFNLLAVIIMWPMRYILNPRWFHKLNGELPRDLQEQSADDQ